MKISDALSVSVIKYVFLIAVWIPPEFSHEFLCWVGGGHGAWIGMQAKRTQVFCLWLWEFAVLRCATLWSLGL